MVEVTKAGVVIDDAAKLLAVVIVLVVLIELPIIVELALDCPAEARSGDVELASGVLEPPAELA